MLHQNTCLDESCFWYKYYCVELHSLTETILEKLGLVLKSLEVALKRSCCKTKLIHFSSHAFLRLAPPPFLPELKLFRCDNSEENKGIVFLSDPLKTMPRFFPRNLKKRHAIEILGISTMHTFYTSSLVSTLPHCIVICLVYNQQCIFPST